MTRTVKYSNKFKKDYDRELRSGKHKTLEKDLRYIIKHLMEDQKLPLHNRDHALTGEWKDFRDCHIKPDLVLIYAKPDHDNLQLVRLGSHSELGL